MNLYLRWGRQEVDNIELEQGAAQRPVVISEFHTRREIS